MPIILSNIKCRVGAAEAEIISLARKALGLSNGDVAEAGIYKISLDARDRGDIHSVCSAMLVLKDPEREKRLEGRRNVRRFEDVSPEIKISSEKRPGRVVTAGFGPAGMFASLILAEQGYRPIVLERGAEVDERTAAVESFWKGGDLDETSNVQFGEGGAGTFSDGKLTTRIGDPLCRYVLKRLVEMGAPREILFQAKPHIGTDRLRVVVKNIRKKIISLGGEIRFKSRLDGINLEGGAVKSVSAAGVQTETSALILAVGHSARDTFELLLDSGILIEPKPFSVGARIEHLQRDVDISLYGRESGEAGLPKGEYQLSHRLPDGRAVYTFCMCPGGEVVAAASERGGTVTNGMSRYSRDGRNANSALVVSVSPADYPSGALGGVEFAQKIERRAFCKSNGFYAPSLTVGEFLGGPKPPSLSVMPTYRPGTLDRDFSGILPDFVTGAMREGIRAFSRSMSCFKDPGALLTGPETRTSSPVRITRGENGCALGTENLYPCGEGAGYAGGIMSAAVDGIKTALRVMESFSPDHD